MARILNKCSFISVHLKTARRCFWTAVNRFRKRCWSSLMVRTLVSCKFSKITHTVLFGSNKEGLDVRCKVYWWVLCFVGACVHACYNIRPLIWYTRRLGVSKFGTAESVLQAFYVPPQIDELCKLWIVSVSYFILSVPSYIKIFSTVRVSERKTAVYWTIRNASVSAQNDSVGLRLLYQLLHCNNVLLLLLLLCRCCRLADSN
jgi:hypothetical protein